MCIIIEKTPTTTISKAWHEEFAANNPDGFGFTVYDQAAHYGERVRTYKTMDADLFYEQIEQLNAAGADAHIHYRQATHGNTSIEMAHPFTIDTEHAGTVAVIHNGMLRDYPPSTDKEHSDTHCFVFGFIAPIIRHMEAQAMHDYLRSPSFHWLVEHMLGSTNRLVITDQHGHITYNDDIWHTRTTGSLAGSRLSNTYAWTDIEAPRQAYDWSKYKSKSKTYSWSDYPSWADSAEDYQSSSEWMETGNTCSLTNPTGYRDTEPSTSSGDTSVIDCMMDEAIDYVIDSQNKSLNQVIDDCMKDGELIAAALYYMMQGDIR